MSEGENWRAVVGFEGFYEVSDQGRVRSLARKITIRKPGQAPYNMHFQPKVLKPLVSRGYRHIVLWNQGVRSDLTIRSLVLTAFVGPRPDGMHACHNNGDSADDRLSNLRWDWPKANNADKRAHGTHQQGERSPASKLTAGDVAAIREAKGAATQSEIGARFGIAQSQVSRIQNRREWSHL